MLLHWPTLGEHLSCCTGDNEMQGVDLPAGQCGDGELLREDRTRGARYQQRKLTAYGHSPILRSVLVTRVIGGV
jgi:hypothetical protein